MVFVKALIAAAARFRDNLSLGLAWLEVWINISSVHSWYDVFVVYYSLEVFIAITGIQCCQIFFLKFLDDLCLTWPNWLVSQCSKKGMLFHPVLFAAV